MSVLTESAHPISLDEALYWADVRKREFTLEESVIFFNGGSKQPTPRQAVNLTNFLNALVAQNPQEGQNTVDRVVEFARDKLARFVGTDASHIALVDNTTMSMNLPGKLILRPGDEVLMSHQEYGAIQNIWQGRVKWFNEVYEIPEGHDEAIKLKKVHIPVAPTQHSEIEDVFAAELNEKTRVMVFSHIYAGTGLVTDPKALSKLAHKHGAWSIVDGAHAVGQVPVTLDDYECDYYGTSLHKWTFGPMGTGMIYIHPDRQNEVIPVVMGFNTEDTATARRYDRTGTRDNSHVAGLTASLKMFERIGWADKIRPYCLGMVRYLKDKIKEIPGARLTVPESIDLSAFLTTWTIDDVDMGAVMGTVAEYLKEKHGLGLQGGGRISTSFYNSYGEIDKFTEALAYAVRKAHGQSNGPGR